MAHVDERDLPLAGFTVGVTAQQRGHEQAALFERAGASVLLGPATARRLVAAVCQSRLDAVTFTSDVAVAGLFATADALGQRERLRHALAGPVCTATMGTAAGAAARALGIPEPVEATEPTLAGLAAAVAATLGRRRHRLRAGGAELVVQGATVQVDGRPLSLSGRELALLDALCREAGSVVRRSALVRDLWGPGANAHTVDVTVARLRRRLGPTGVAIRTVPRRGYWLDASLAD